MRTPKISRRVRRVGCAAGIAAAFAVASAPGAYATATGSGSVTQTGLVGTEVISPAQITGNPGDTYTVTDTLTVTGNVPTNGMNMVFEAPGLTASAMQTQMDSLFPSGVIVCVDLGPNDPGTDPGSETIYCGSFSPTGLLPGTYTITMPVVVPASGSSVYYMDTTSAGNVQRLPVTASASVGTPVANPGVAAGGLVAIGLGAIALRRSRRPVA